MNRNKLNFEEMATSLNVLDCESLKGVKGGNDTPNDDCVDYNLVIPEVVVTETPLNRSYTNIQFWSRSNGLGSYYNNYNQGGFSSESYFGGGGGSGGFTNSSNSSSGPSLYDALMLMTGSADLALTGADVGARVLKTGLPAGFKIAGRSFLVLSVADNFNQMYNDGINLNDSAQIAASIGLAAFATTIGAPWVIAGGIALFAWDLAEQYNEGGQ